MIRLLLSMFGLTSPVDLRMTAGQGIRDRMDCLKADAGLISDRELIVRSLVLYDFCRQVRSEGLRVVVARGNVILKDIEI